jgi:hypothetical protein
MNLRRIQCFFILLFGLSCSAQNNYIDWDKESIIKDFRDLSESNEKYLITTKDSSGILKIEITGHEKINCEFRFDSLGVCITSNFVYCCDDCSEKHVKEFVEHKYYRWIKKSPGLYYSKRKRKTQMEIFNSNPFATVIVFTKTNWTKEQYKALIKKQ